MKLARIIRPEKSEQGMIGILVINDVIQCFTLERDDTFIRQGCYTCSRFHGEKYKDTFEVQVHGHSAVLFHPGNVETDTQGCILLGNRVGWLDGKRAVLESVKAFEAFMELMGEDSEFTLFVENRL